MPDFAEAEEERRLCAALHEFALQEIRPLSLEADRTEEIPPSFYAAVAKHGVRLEAMPRDPRAGMAGAPRLLLSVLAAEELAWGDASFLLSLPGPGLGGPPVSFIGTPEQQERFFRIFSDPTRPHFGAYAMTEPDAGSDVAGIRTRAVPVDGGWRLDGDKVFITNGSKADWVVVFATVDPALGAAGHRAFVVERGTPGLRVARRHRKLGLRASDTAELVLEDCFVPEENLLGGRSHYEVGKGGFKVAMQTFDATRPLVAAMAVGIARAAVERTRLLLDELLPPFSSSPSRQVLRTRLADMERRVDAARLLTWKAAFLADQGAPQSRAASMAKAYAGTVAVAVCREALDLTALGGAPPDPWLEKWFRDIRVFDIFEGTAQIQRLVVARRLFEEIGAKVGL